MIINFDEPHKIGTVCRWPCPQCGESADIPINESTLTWDSTVSLSPAQPLLILREATRDEYLAQCQTLAPGLRPAPNGYNYEVSTD